MRRDHSTIGALQLLSNSEFSKNFPLNVVEGAPGQGKSTVTQMLCQIHRMALLGRGDLGKLKKIHHPTDARIPFRIDLRDYATWLAGHDPFGDDAQVGRPAGSSPVLESFLAAQVARHTGRSFDVDDFAAVAKISQVLIVLDGFDEVADVTLRNRIVSEVADASARISVIALLAQIVVTSRPAAFANSPGFSRDEFQHIELASLTHPAIIEYANKWLDGRDTDLREKRSVIGVLEEKLRQPHVRDLARNPMQLAILLALISVRGASLPDKRTALYDSYIDIFLNREAEKSKVVRDHRTVLLKIHRYLAWMLQMEAESSRGVGHISETRLRSVLHQFLETEGHKTELVDDLFQGVVERVFVLVSRVQGTFEFEVQPLREYFAARYLYDTAPYSPTGTALAGTLPERFLALAPNFYWLNVTRFFAGCYSTGELASLRYGLKQLEEKKIYRYTSHLPELIVTLLQDHVFSDQPLISLDMTKWLFDEPMLTVLLSKRNAFAHESGLSVPTGRSRDYLIEKLLEIVRSDEHSDRTMTACRAILSNTERNELFEIWSSLEGSCRDADRWLWIAQVLDVIEAMTAIQFANVFARLPQIAIRAVMVGRIQLIEATPGAWHYVIQRAFRVGMYTAFRAEIPTSKIGYFCFLVLRLFANEPFEMLLDGPVSTTLHNSLFSRRPRLDLADYDAEKFFAGAQELLGEEGKPLAAAADNLLRAPASAAWRDTNLWIAIFEQWRKLWGEPLRHQMKVVQFVRQFNLNANVDISTSSEKLSEVEHAIAIRNSAKTPRLVLTHLSELRTQSHPHYYLALVSCLVFLPFEQLLEYQGEIAHHLDALDKSLWIEIANGLDEVTAFRSSSRKPKKKGVVKKVALHSSLRMTSVLVGRSDPKITWARFAREIKDYRGDDGIFLEKSSQVILNRIGASDFDWDAALGMISHAYKHNRLPLFTLRHRRPDPSTKIPIDVAHMICRNARAYPLDLVDLAERAVALGVGAGAQPLAEISQRDQWFPQSAIGAGV